MSSAIEQVPPLPVDAANFGELGKVHSSSDASNIKSNSDGMLVASPYTSWPHLLDLSTLSRPNQLMARALTAFRPVVPEYATAPYIEAFNWDVVIDQLRRLSVLDNSYQWEDQSFYVVVFRSQIPPTTDRSHLGALDEASHAEAMQSGGLMKYWFGTPDSSGRNLATCKHLP